MKKQAALEHKYSTLLTDIKGEAYIDNIMNVVKGRQKTAYRYVWRETISDL